MIPKADRFWITLVLRAAIGFLFLAASINIFSAGGPHDFGPDAFARRLASGFEASWMGDWMPMINNPFRKSPEKTAEAQEAAPAAKEGEGAKEGEAAPAGKEGEAVAKKPAPKKKAAPTDMVHPTYLFLYLMPFIFAALSAPILTGIFLKPALRSGALLMVMLGVGKYISDGKDLSTTANDFFFAFLICVGLAFIAQGEREAAGSADAE